MVARPTLNRVLWALTTLIAGVGWVRGLPHLFQIGERMDLAAYYGAGVALARGFPLYDSAAWASFMQGIRYTPYIYPPFMAVLMQLVVPLGWSRVDAMWLVINLLLTVAVVRELRLIQALSMRQTVLVAIMVCWLPAWYENLLFGQVGLFVTWGLLYAVRARAWQAGGVLALLVAIKVYPLVFVWPVLRGRWRRGTVALVVGLLVTAGVGIWGTSWSESWGFWRDAQFMQAPAPLWAPSRQGFYNVALRLWQPHDLIAAVLSVDATQTYRLPALIDAPWLVWPTWAIASGVVGWYSWRWYRAMPRSLVDTLAVVSCLFLLIFPAQHNHYSIQMVLPLAVLVSRAESRWHWPVALLALALFRWWRPLLLVSVSPLLMMWSMLGVLLVWYLLITPSATALPRDQARPDPAPL
jgi:hypothetical protein